MNEQQQPIMDWKTQLKLVAGSAAAAEVINLLAHGGWEGALFGAAAAAIVGSQSPKLFEGLRDLLPVDLLEQLNQREPGKRSIMDKLLGRYPEDYQYEEQYQEDDSEEEEEIETESLQREIETRSFPQPVLPHSSRGDKPMLQLAHQVAIPAGEIAGKAIFIAGVRRSGKTTLGVRLAEQMSKLDQPLFVPDLEGDWLSAATTTFKHGRVFAHPSAQQRYADCDFEAVTVETADIAGFNMLEDGAQAVLDMASYPGIDEACLVSVGIIKGLFAWSEQYPDDRVLCHVYLDEAQRFLPQTLTDSIIQDKGVLQALLKAYMDLIAVGGKRGLSPVILTQRFAQVNKKIMAQSEVFFLLRQTNENDLARCMEYVNKKTASEEEISQFEPGQGVYIAASGQQMVVRFLPRESDGKRGSTPTLEAAQRRYGEARQRQKSEQTQQSELPTSPPQTSRSPLAPATTSVDRALQMRQRREEKLRELRSRKQAERVTEEIAVMPEPTTAELSPAERKAQQEQELLAKAIKAWDEGYKTQEKMAIALGLTPWQVRAVYQKVKLEKGIV